MVLQFLSGAFVSGISTFVGFVTFSDYVFIQDGLNVAGVIPATSFDGLGQIGVGSEGTFIVLVLPWLTLSLPMQATQLMLTVLQVSQRSQSQPEFQSVSQSAMAVNKYLL